MIYGGFPGSSEGKESAYNAGDLDSILGLGPTSHNSAGSTLLNGSLIVLKTVTLFSKNRNKGFGAFANVGLTREAAAP